MESVQSRTESDRETMLVPLLASSVFVLMVVALCFARPNAGRIFLGVFFWAMALGVNGSFTFGNPQAYLEYANGALLPWYRNLAVSVVAFVSPVVFGILLIAFEIAMGAFILHKGKFVKIGLFGTMLFLAGMVPLSWLQLPWLGLIAGEAHLFRQDFESSLLDRLMGVIGKTSNVSNKT
jgi:hypothetical protein